MDAATAELRGVMAYTSVDRFNQYRKKADQITTCNNHECHRPLPKFVVDGRTIKMFYGEKKKTHPVTLTAREAHAILSRISDDTMKLLGFNHGLSPRPEFIVDGRHVHAIRPEAMIFTVLPVLPTCARPWVIKGSERKDDDLTEKYISIIKINNRLKSDREGVPIGAKGKKKEKMSEHTRALQLEALQTAIWTLQDNSKDKSKNTNRQHKGIRERLTGKEGHIQSNVAGKRCNLNARTVIVGGGSMIRIGQVGVPQYVASKMSEAEIVTEYSLPHYERLLQERKIIQIIRQGFTIIVAKVTENYTKPFIWNDYTGLKVHDIIHREFDN